MIPPGGSSNFSAFSPNQWAANTGGLMSAFAGFGDNSICTGVDGTTDAQKLIYTSPVFAGFQLTASYTPSGGDETHGDGVGAHVGMPINTPGESRHNTSVALNYGYEGDGWGLAASLGGSWEGHREEDNDNFGGANVSFGEQDFYQAGINLFIGNFAIGVGGEIYHDLVDIRFEGESITIDSWVAGDRHVVRLRRLDLRRAILPPRGRIRDLDRRGRGDRPVAGPRDRHRHLPVRAGHEFRCVRRLHVARRRSGNHRLFGRRRRVRRLPGARIRRRRDPHILIARSPARSYIQLFEKCAEVAASEWAFRVAEFRATGDLGPAGTRGCLD